MNAPLPVQWLEYWPWREALGEVLDPRFYPIDYLDDLILSNAARIWVSEAAAIIAEIRTYPGGAKTVHGLVAAGELGEIRRLIPLAEAWGRESGAIGAEIESRMGWARALKGDGYEPMQLKLRKDFV